LRRTTAWLGRLKATNASRNAVPKEK